MRTLSGLKDLKILVIVFSQINDGNWEYLNVLNSWLLGSGARAIFISDKPLTPLTDVGYESAVSELSEATVGKFCVENRVDTIFPIDDWSSFLIANLNQRLGLQGIRPQQTLILEKWEFHKLNLRLKIPCPDAMVIDHLEDLERLRAEFRGPVIIKPTRGFAHRRMRQFNYRMEPDIGALLDRLKEKGRLGAIVSEDRSDRPLGRHMIQKYIAHEILISCNFAAIEGSLRVISYSRFFYRSDKRASVGATGTFHDVPVLVQNEIERLLRLYQEHLRLQECFGSLQMILTPLGELYPIDFHLRLTDSMFILHAQFEPELLTQAFAAALSGGDFPNRSRLHALKVKIWQDIEKNTEIQLPRFDETQFRICNYDPNVPFGRKDPRKFKSQLDFFVTCASQTSLQDCWRKVEDFKKGISKTTLDGKN